MTKNHPPKQVEAMHARMLRLRDDLAAAEPRRPVALDETFEAFGVTLEELRVSEEHLRDTNDLLLTTRQRLDSERRRYRELFDLAPDAYLVTDRDGVIRDANRAASSLLGVPQRFLEGKVLANFVPDAERRDFRSSLSDAGLATGTTRMSLRVRPRIGGPIDVEVSVSPASGPSGRDRELLWLFRDVTGRDRREVAPQPVARDQLLDLIDTVAVVVWEADPESGRLTFVSREVEAFLGLPAETLLDAPDGWTGRVHGDDFADYSSLHARQAADRTDLELEYRLVAADGRSVWVREISRFVPASAAGPEALRGVLYTVNRWKKMERKLHYARADAESEVRDLRLLQDLCERLTRSIELPTLLADVVSGVTSILGSVMGSVSIVDLAGDEVRIASSAGLSLKYLTAANAGGAGDPTCSRALSERRSVSFADVETEGEFAPVVDLYRAEGIRATFAVPLFSGTGHAIGVATAYFPEPHRPPERQQALVELYARQAGQALAIAQRLADLFEGMPGHPGQRIPNS